MFKIFVRILTFLFLFSTSMSFIWIYLREELKFVPESVVEVQLMGLGYFVLVCIGLGINPVDSLSK